MSSKNMEKISIPQQFLCSAKDLKKPSVLAGAAMLAALEIIVSAFFTLDIGFSLKIGFAYLVMAMYGYLYGPATAILIAVVADLISFSLRPSGQFFIGFTLIEATQAMIYGICLYKKQITVLRCILTRLFVVLFINIFLNTAMISFTYGSPFWANLPVRAVKNVLLYPLETVLLYFTMKALEQIFLKMGKTSLHRT